jgi:hypothetical protein
MLSINYSRTSNPTPDVLACHISPRHSNRHLERLPRVDWGWYPQDQPWANGALHEGGKIPFWVFSGTPFQRVVAAE